MEEVSSCSQSLNDVCMITDCVCVCVRVRVRVRARACVRECVCVISWLDVCTVACDSCIYVCVCVCVSACSHVFVCTRCKLLSWHLHKINMLHLHTSKMPDFQGSIYMRRLRACQKSLLPVESSYPIGPSSLTGRGDCLMRC